MTNDQIDEAVLRVLSGQHPDYLIHHEATAFVVEGLDGDTVAASLQRLEAAGFARLDQVVGMTYELEPLMVEEMQYTDPKDPTTAHVVSVQATSPDGQPVFVPVTGPDGGYVLVEAKDDAGNPVVLAEGWCCTDAGHASAIKHAEVPNPEKLAGALVQAIVSAGSFDQAKQGLAAIEQELSS